MAEPINPTIPAPYDPKFYTNVQTEDVLAENEEEPPQEKLGEKTNSQISEEELQKLHDWETGPDEDNVPFSPEGITIETAAHAAHAILTDPLVKLGGHAAEAVLSTIPKIIGAAVPRSTYIQDKYNTYIRDSYVGGLAANYGAATQNSFTDKVTAVAKKTLGPDNAMVTKNAAYSLEEWGVGWAPFFITPIAEGVGAIAHTVSPIMEHIAYKTLANLKTPAAIAEGIAKYGSQWGAFNAASEVYNLAVSDLNNALTGKELLTPGQQFGILATSAAQGFMLGATGFGLVVATPPLAVKAGKIIKASVNKVYETVTSQIERTRKLRKGEKAPAKSEKEGEIVAEGSTHTVLTAKDITIATAKSAMTQTSVDYPSPLSYFKALASKTIKNIKIKHGIKIQKYLGLVKEKIAQDRKDLDLILKEVHGLSDEELKQVPAYHLAKVAQLWHNVHRITEYKGEKFTKLLELNRRINKIMPNTGVHLRLKNKLGFDARSLSHKDQLRLIEEREQLSTHEGEIQSLEQTLKEPYLNISKKHRALLESKLESLRKVKGEHGPTILMERLHQIDDEISEFKGYKNDYETIIEEKLDTLTENDKEAYVAATHNLPPSSIKLEPKEKIEAATELSEAKETGQRTGLEKETEEKISINDLQNLTPTERKAAEIKIKVFDKLESKFRDIRTKGKDIFKCLTRID